MRESRGWKRAAAAVVALALTTACAQHVEFVSNPPGAHLWINGQDLGLTPARGTFSYTAFSNFEVILEKEGYATYRGSLPTDVKVGHLVFGLLCCWPALIWMQGPVDHYQFIMSPVAGGMMGGTMAPAAPAPTATPVDPWAMPSPTPR